MGRLLDIFRRSDCVALDLRVSVRSTTKLQIYSPAGRERKLTLGGLTSSISGGCDRFSSNRRSGHDFDLWVRRMILSISSIKDGDAMDTVVMKGDTIVYVLGCVCMMRATGFDGLSSSFMRAEVICDWKVTYDSP
jgi:hypothetical protein